jgi:spermidine synthase
VNLSPRRFRFLMLLLFAGSGCSALIYEIVWYQLLQFVIGAAAISLAVLLATFLGGLCIGSIAVPRVAALRRLHPLRVYAALELGIGICGVAVLFGIPVAGQIYVAAANHGLPAILLRAAVCSICLLPPTMMMGASLPVAARWTEMTPEGARWVGLWYGANVAGAVFGCLFAGFYLLRVFDMHMATYAAVSINFAVALISFGASLRVPATVAEDSSPQARTVTSGGHCPFGGFCVRRGGDLDAPVKFSFGRFGVHLFSGPRSFFGGSGTGRRRGLLIISVCESTKSNRLVSVIACGGYRMERLYAGEVRAVLAD